MKEYCKLIECSKMINNKLVDLVYHDFKHLEQYSQLKHSKSEVNKLLSNDNFYGILLYSTNNRLIGYLLGQKMELDDGRYVYYISYLFVLKKYRSTGIGKRLLKKLILLCKSKFGINFILLICENNNFKAYNFYRSFGFVDDKLIPHPNGNKILTYFI